MFLMIEKSVAYVCDPSPSRPHANLHCRSQSLTPEYDERSRDKTKTVCAAAGTSVVGGAISVIVLVGQNPARPEIGGSANGDNRDYAQRSRCVRRQLKNCSHDFLLLSLLFLL